MSRRILFCATSEEHSEYAFHWMLERLLRADDALYILSVHPSVVHAQDYFTSSFGKEEGCLHRAEGHFI